ncbi:hypothetical protein AWB77_06648 [Caballeronia fortuita]|uniref:Uncharacterized protein n=1 Tax=Caballeronia fortuita TaxID=1777138 RepID=A0A158EAB9_9BURK|nr:hypothetical protein [Caballeronia fortuita]SAL02857.1 hypothetical protein AWB77_06648 [Caballeronia fortuita]
METRDQLVRLTIGAIQEEMGIPDSMLLTGDLLYLLWRGSGEVRYLHVPLDLEMIESVRKSTRGNAGGVYRNCRGEPTPLALYLASVFLRQNVPIDAIRQELGLTEATMNRLLDVRHFADDVTDHERSPQLLKLSTFEGNAPVVSNHLPSASGNGRVSVPK